MQTFLPYADLTESLRVLDNKGKSFLDGEITEQLGLSVMGLRFSDVIDTIFNKDGSI